MGSIDRFPSARDVRECNEARDYSGLTFSSPLAPFVKLMGVVFMGKKKGGRKGC